LWVHSADGVKGEVSLQHLVGKGAFALWGHSEQFAKVYIDAEFGTVCWPGGLNLTPDALYDRITGVSESPTAPRSS